MFAFVWIWFKMYTIALKFEETFNIDNIVFFVALA